MNKQENTYIIAELSANHNGSFELAKKTINAIKEAGADAVKLQTYTPDSLSLDLENAYIKKICGGLWDGYKPYDLYKLAQTPWEWQPELAAYAISLGLDWLSSPFDNEAVDFLESINCPAYKIASYEITHIPLIEYAASKGKPMIISTGLAEIDDITLAIDACHRVGNNDITLLKCTSQYPANIEDANLSTINDMRRRFNVPVGLSDHSPGSIVPIVAVSLGATIVEKHFILDRSLGGADSAFSMEPDEFNEMVRLIRQAEATLGKITYDVSPSDKENRRSLFAVEDIKADEAFTEANVRSIRPGYGLHPKYLNDILGKVAKTDLSKGTPLRFDHIQ